MHTLARLLQRIGDVNSGGPRPLVTLEEFFTGNNDWGSIGCNLPDQVSPQEFLDILLPIRNRDDVADIRIEISSHEEPDMWPFSETVWVVSSMNRNQLESLLPDKIKPDDWLPFPPQTWTNEPLEIPEGMQAFGIWYD